MNDTNSSGSDSKPQTTIVKIIAGEAVALIKGYTKMIAVWAVIGSVMVIPTTIIAKLLFMLVVWLWNLI